MLAPGAEARHPWTKRAVRLIQWPFLDRAAFLHALSEREMEDLRTYGARADTLVAPNGIDVSAFPSPVRRSPREVAETPDAEGLLFAFVGRLDPNQKGLDLLLEGFAQASLAMQGCD